MLKNKRKTGEFIDSSDTKKVKFTSSDGNKANKATSDVNAKKVKFTIASQVGSNDKAKNTKKDISKKDSFGKSMAKTFLKKQGEKGSGKGVKNQESEKPKWAEMKKEKKQLRIVRRKAKASAEIFEISSKAKLLSAQIQRKVVKPDFKINASKELHGMLKGQYKSIALTHDLSRVIQVLLKYAPEDVRSEITEELIDLIVSMVQSKYAHHSVKRILKYGKDFIRHEVIKQFYGHIVSIASHSISAPVLDYAYGEFASQKEKLYMQQEFYGDIYKNSKDDSVKTLCDSYKGSPEMKQAILSSCKANIQRILDKNLHDSELLHTVLYDYIQECSSEDRAELITTLSALIVPLSNSLPGVNAASMCVWQGTNKDKKTILKVVKEHAVPLSIHKTGYRLLLAIFDSVDDTVLVKKAIISTIANSIKEIAKDHWGKMTLHWLVKPNDTAAFHPNLIKFLKEGAKSGTSKKDAGIRVSELREAILPALFNEIQSDPKFWVQEPTIALLTATILSIESSKDILLALSKAICDPEWIIKKDDNEIAAIEDAGMHMCLKKMAVMDKDNNVCSFGEAIAENLNNDTLKLWLPTNRGCFFLLKLIENNNKDVVKKLISKITSQVHILEKQTSQGAKLLLQKLQH